MHDGSVATLEEVVAFYNRGGNPNPNLDSEIRPRRMNARDESDLVEFLKALTSRATPESPAETVHSPHRR
jgi:cytochrome c peroxidase